MAPARTSFWLGRPLCTAMACVVVLKSRAMAESESPGCTVHCTTLGQTRSSVFGSAGRATVVASGGAVGVAAAALGSVWSAASAPPGPVTGFGVELPAGGAGADAAVTGGVVPAATSGSEVRTEMGRASWPAYRYRW